MLVSVSRTVMQYKHKSNDLNDRLTLRLKELAEKHRRYGHIRLYVLIRREGLIINHKRTERIYRREGLSLRIRRRRKFAYQYELIMDQNLFLRCWMNGHTAMWLN